MTWIIKRTAVVRDKMKNDSTKPIQAPLDVVARKWTEPRNHSMWTAVHKSEEQWTTFVEVTTLSTVQTTTQMQMGWRGFVDGLRADVSAIDAKRPSLTSQPRLPAKIFCKNVEGLPHERDIHEWIHVTTVQEHREIQNVSKCHANEKTTCRKKTCRCP